MKFKFKADIEFEAEDLDHAFRQLAKHFIDLCLDEEYDKLHMLGEFNIFVEDKDNQGTNRLEVGYDNPSEPWRHS